MENTFWLSNEEFNYIYGTVQRLAVDVVIRKDNGIILVKRAIEPYLNYWHLPGGTIYKGETVKDAAIRIAKNETGLDVNFVGSLGYMEFLKEDRDRVHTHTISIAVEVIAKEGAFMLDKNASDIKVISELSISPLVTEHLDFLQKHKLLK